MLKADLGIRPLLPGYLYLAQSEEPCVTHEPFSMLTEASSAERRVRGPELRPDCLLPGSEYSLDTCPSIRTLLKTIRGHPRKPL